MLSRGSQLLRTAYRVNRTRNPVSVNTIRHGHGGKHYYRELPVDVKNWTLFAEVIGGLTSWWVMWNLYHGYKELVFGHYDFPDASAWTDEELGIPPDTES